MIMKIFVSWSGELSQKVAHLLKKWLPCIIQSVEVFYSTDDIEKGENWDSKIAGELSECKYGIICLTAENTTAPWINFEAGAIAKTLDSRVTALMINIKPSDIQGPLRRYQATKLDRNDVFQLVSGINNVTEIPLAPSVLETAFNALWDNMYKEICDCIDEYDKRDPEETHGQENLNSEAVEEILQLVRKQNSLLNDPELLFPPKYFEYLQREFGNSRKGNEVSVGLRELAQRTEMALDRIQYLKESGDDSLVIFRDGFLFDVLEILIFGVFPYCTDVIPRRKVAELKEGFRQCVES